MYLSKKTRLFLTVLFLFFLQNNLAFSESIDVLSKLHEKSGIKTISSSPSRCGGECGRMCSLQPDCVWENKIENLRIIRIIDDRISENNPDKDVILKQGKKQIEVRKNCSRKNKLPKISRDYKYKYTEFVSYTNKKSIKNKLEKKLTVDISAKLNIVGLDVGGEIKETIEIDIGSSNTKSLNNESIANVSIDWEEVPPREMHWLSFYKPKKTLNFKYNGNVVFDADVVSRKRVYINGKLGQVWESRAPVSLSSKYLPDIKDRTFPISSEISLEAGDEIIVHSFNDKDLTEEDCDDAPPIQ